MEWETVESNLETEENLARGLNIPSFVAKMFVNRGISSISEALKFMNPKLSDLHDPFLMKGMSEGVVRIRKAIQEGESICVFGDYDADGICGTALLVLTLQKLGAKVKYYIPHRLKEGYGLRKESLKKLRDEGTNLLITVDCGITSLEEIGFAHAIGMEVILTDHHRSLAMLPPAEVIINPLQTGCQYPFKELAGVGIVFKFCQALTGLKNEELLRPESHLDLVTLGTIADLVPLQGENRILVKYGLMNFGRTDKVGLKALSEVSGANLNNIDVSHLGYRFAPRINAGGRIGDAARGLNLLLSRNFSEARIIASMLDADNKTRQKIQREVFAEARNLASCIDLKNEGIIFLLSRSWHRGVIGIVASRLSEEYNYPTIIVSLEDGIGYASSRSVRGVDIMEVLSSGADLYSSYGGHKYAAGFTIKEEKIDELKRRIKNTISKLPLEKSLYSKFVVEAEIEPEEIIKETFGRWIHMFLPFGKGNSLPTFFSKNMVLLQSPQIFRGRHLQLMLGTEFGSKEKESSVEAIGFGMSKLVEKLDKGDCVDIIFSPRINNNSNLQINLEDIEIQRRETPNF